MISQLLSKYTFGLHGAAPVFVILSFFTLAVIGIFSNNYLQGEQGRLRFWFLYTLFAAGILICGFSSNLESFFLGWEMVGLASFFLIGFYQTNVRSLENSLIALSNYKMCDIFFVMAIFLEESQNYTLAGACLIIATLAKSAQFPFSSWLYRALEGPTPSSTVFYGGLSLHLGAFLLIQQSEVWAFSIPLKIFLGLIGLVSVFYGLFVGSTRSDIKTSFAFASISQVGLIYMEIACGWYEFALWHIVGHNILRTWNYLRSSSFFDDFFREEHHSRFDFMGSLLKKLPVRLYYHAFNGFYLDSIFIFLRNLSLIFFIGVSVLSIFPRTYQGEFHWEFLFLALSTLLSTYYFLKPRLKIKYQWLNLIVSQVFVLAAIHLFFEDFMEETYLVCSLIFLAGIYYSLRPAIKIWRQGKSRNGDLFLGLSQVHPYRHVLYLFCVISVSASPGSLQFFLQEKLFDDLWNKSHTFMMLSLVGLTLNTYHFFRLGQQAFLGEYLNQNNFNLNSIKSKGTPSFFKSTHEVIKEL